MFPWHYTMKGLAVLSKVNLSDCQHFTYALLQVLIVGILT